MIEYHSWPERLVFFNKVQESMPFICRQAAHRDYSEVILSTLMSNRNYVDVSCNTSAEDDFCGNPIFREKVNLQMSDFVRAWSHHRRGLHHWILDAGLQLYLSQCCFSCPSDRSTCDLDPDILQVQCPPVLEQHAFTCAQTNLWMNIHQAKSTLHYDGSDNLLVLVHGVKHVTIISPEYTKYLRPMPASDDNPNHSCMSFHEVEERLNELTSAETRNAAQPLNIYRTTLQEGDALFIPEGWWHQVCSEPSSMALNFWFTTSATSTSEAGRRGLHQTHCRSYLLRSLVHSMLVEKHELEAKRDDTPVVSPMYRPPLPYQAFESQLLEMLGAAGEQGRGAPSSPIEDNDSPSVAKSSTEVSTCGKRRSARLPDAEPKRTRIAMEGQTGGGGDEERGWVNFVRCRVDEQKVLWIPFATAHPEEWQRVLLSLPSEACAHLLDYWDTLRPAEGETVADARTANCGVEGLLETVGGGSVLRPIVDTTGTTEDPGRHTVVADLDGFFERLFAPCGENTAQVRRHLIQQKNAHNEARARRMLSDVLGMSLE